MRKIFTLFALLVFAIANAQTPFITPVTYRGAFAPSPTAMWTTGWTNWDPQNAPYSAGIDSVINTPITTNYTLSGTKKYLLQGLVYVTNNATLTINAGCLIKGDFNVANSSLVITRGAKLNAKGLSTKPIIFTSAKPAGSRGKGDWGGVILLGKAHYNGAGGQNFIEGIAQSPNTQYGGGANPDDNDNSGVMQYVRIEFGGYIFAQNQEINGLTLGAVGRGTTISHIQVSYANDDAFEWFGGSVNCKYLVSYRNLDDNWDTDNGYNGSVQFCLGLRDPQISDNPAVSTSEGYESDNDASGTNAKPFTSALFCNITDIGPYRGDPTAVVASGFRRSVRIRRNSHLRIMNSIMMDFPTGILVDGAACTALANGTYLSSTPNNSPGNLVFKNNLLAGNRIGKVIETNTVWDPYTWFGANKNDSLVATTNILTNPYDSIAYDFRPVLGSPALKNYNFNDSAFFFIDSTGALATLVTCPATVATPSIVVGPTLACTYIGSGNPAKYYVTAKSNLGVLRYEWSVPAGATVVAGQGTDSVWVVYGNTFTGGSVTVVNRSYCGATGAARALAVKKGNPTLAGTVTGPAFVCSYIGTGDSATYSVSAILNATSYIWAVPVGATIVNGQGTQTIKVLFDNSFVSGNVTVKGSSVCGDGPLRSYVLTKISAAPGTITGGTVTCGYSSVAYSIAPVTNATSYLWTVPTGASIATGQGTTSISVNYPTAVAGYVTVKAVTNCGQSAAKSLTVAKVGVPTSITGSTLVCPFDAPNYVVNDALNNSGSVTYSWGVPAGISITNGQGTSSLDVSVDPSFLSGNLTVIAVGCGASSAAKTLAISTNPTCKRVAKSSPAKMIDFSVAPNPSKGNFTIYFDSKQKADKGTIVISNLFGQVISQRSVSISNGIINEQIAESKLAPGVYIVKVTVGNKNQTSKIVIQ